MPVMHPGRVDVIGAGALSCACSMDEFGLAEVVVSEHDILDGIAWRARPRPAQRSSSARPPTRASSVPRTRSTPQRRHAGRASVRAARSCRRPRRARRRRLGLPGLPAAGRLARGGGAGEARARSRDEPYWGRPGPGFRARRTRGSLVLGLAPAAHGGNRTGRVFTGDRSRRLAVRRAAPGRAGQPADQRRTPDDGLALTDTRIVAAVRCAPPDNKPTPAERDTCAPWLRPRAAAARRPLRVVVALGGFAWDARCGRRWPRGLRGARGPRPAFGHGGRGRAARPLGR